MKKSNAHKRVQAAPVYGDIPATLRSSPFGQVVTEWLSGRPHAEWPAIIAEWEALLQEFQPNSYPAYARVLSGSAENLQTAVQALQRRWGNAFPASFYRTLLSPIGEDGKLSSRGLGYVPAHLAEDRITDTVLHALGMSSDLFRAVDEWLAQYGVEVSHWGDCGCCGREVPLGNNRDKVAKVEAELAFHSQTFCTALVWQRLVWESCPHLPSFKDGPQT